MALQHTMKTLRYRLGEPAPDTRQTVSKCLLLEVNGLTERQAAGRHAGWQAGRQAGRRRDRWTALTDSGTVVFFFSDYISAFILNV
jgi:hypothetical protein